MTRSVLGNKFVVGVSDIVKAAQEAGTKVTKQAVRNALREGAVVIRDEARRRVSVRTGALKKSIVAETRGVKGSQDAKGRPTRHVAVVTIQRKAFEVNDKGRAVKAKLLKRGEVAKNITGKVYPRNYAHLVEFGTAPHALGGGSTVRDRKTGAAGEQKGAKHPGSRPKAFMRPAYDTKRAEAEKAIAARLRVEIAKAVEKAAAKKSRRR